MGPVSQYITDRIAELDKLIAKEPEGSLHVYPLQAGQYELLKLAVHLQIALNGY